MQKLSLRFNSIRIVHPDAMRGLFQLKSLDLRQNSLSFLAAEVFTDLVQLEELDLSENNLATLDPNVLRPLLRLRKLSLASNSFKTISSSANLPRLQSLEFLSLADNDLTEITHETLGTMMPDLRHLDVSSNRVKFVAVQSFINTPLLETIDLFSNSLSYLDPVSMQTLRNLNSLLIGENPLVCDCKLKPLRKFYQQIVTLNPSSMTEEPLIRQSIFSRRNKLKSACELSHTCAPVCASPFFLKGHSFFDLSASELACTTTTSTTTTTTTSTTTTTATTKMDLVDSYVALLNENIKTVGGMLVARGKKPADASAGVGGEMMANLKSNGNFDESLAIAIGIVTSVLLLSLLVIGTLCFRHYFYQRNIRQCHRSAKSSISTGNLQSTSTSSHHSDDPTTTSSHSSSPGIETGKQNLTLSLHSGMTSASQSRFNQSISYDAFGDQQTLGYAGRNQQKILAEYASIFPGSSSFNLPVYGVVGNDNYFIGSDGKAQVVGHGHMNQHQQPDHNGLLLQTVLAAAGSNKVPSLMSSSNDVRSSGVPRSESLV